MKTTEQLKPNYAPVYCAAMYPALCEVFQRHGYALAVHGSLARDFDLVAVPWVDEASDPGRVLEAITAEGFCLQVVGDQDERPHGRTTYMLSVGFGQCACDLSFVSRDNAARARAEQEADTLRRQVRVLADHIATVGECPSDIADCLAPDDRETEESDCAACWSAWAAQQAKEGGGK